MKRACLLALILATTFPRAAAPTIRSTRRHPRTTFRKARVRAQRIEPGSTRLGLDALRVPDWLLRDGNIDWSRAIVDSCSVRAVCGETQTGPSPTDHARRGSKRHL